MLKGEKKLFSWAEVRGRQLSNLEKQGICSGSHRNICVEAMGENEEMTVYNKYQDNLVS